MVKRPWTLGSERAHAAVGLALGARLRRVVREVHEGAAAGIEIASQLRGHCPTNTPGRRGRRRRIAETQDDPLHARIGGHHRVIPGEQQHSMRGGRVELRQQPQRAPGGGQRSTNRGWQRAVPAEHLGAGAQRVETQVDG